MHASPAIWIVLAACAVAAVTDVRSRRIPNPLTAALALAALVLHGMQGPAALGIAAATLVGVLLLGFVAFSFRWLGGGDVKLLAASAATLGFPDAVPFLLYTAVGGGALAVGIAVATGRLRPVLASTAAAVRPMLYPGTVATAPATRTTFPYAVAIAFGALLVALSHSALPMLRLVAP